MHPFVYDIPVKVYFGENQLGHLGEELALCYICVVWFRRKVGSTWRMHALPTSTAAAVALLFI